MDRLVALEALRQLTPPQKQLLRLVHQGIVDSKLLARETGLQPSSIKSYLYLAAKILRVSGRADAAAIFAEIERAEAAGEFEPPDEAASGELTGISTANPVAEPLENGTFVGAEPGRSAAATRSWPLPVPTKERQWNDLSALQKRVWVIAIALGFIASGGALVAAARFLLLGPATGH